MGIMNMYEKDQWIAALEAALAAERRDGADIIDGLQTSLREAIDQRNDAQGLADRLGGINLALDLARTEERELRKAVQAELADAKEKLNLLALELIFGWAGDAWFSGEDDAHCEVIALDGQDGPRHPPTALPARRGRVIVVEDTILKRFKS